MRPLRAPSQANKESGKTKTAPAASVADAADGGAHAGTMQGAGATSRLNTPTKYRVVHRMPIGYTPGPRQILGALQQDEALLDVSYRLLTCFRAATPHHMLAYCTALHGL